MCIYLHSFQLPAAFLTTIYTYTLVGTRVRAPSVFKLHWRTRACTISVSVSVSTHTHTHRQ